MDLGEIDLEFPLDPNQTLNLLRVLSSSGFELLEGRKNIIVNQIITIITRMIHHDEQPKINYSNYISSKLAYKYTYLANIFSAAKGITIEKYIIIHKIERVKELIEYGELSLSEIAYTLHYNSGAHLSFQFKKNNRSDSSRI